MVGRRRVPAHTPWGDIVGYSRAIRIGNAVAVSGTAASDENGKIIGEGDIYTQTVFIIKKIRSALRELGASLDDVVRTRIYTKEITKWKEIARAHHEFFGRIKPTSTMIQVARFIDEDMLVEVEAEAIIETQQN